MGIDDESSHPELCSEVADGVTRNIVCLFREPDAGNPPVRFDEREQETELGQTGLRRVTRKRPNSHREAKATAPVLDSTHRRWPPLTAQVPSATMIELVPIHHKHIHNPSMPIQQENASAQRHSGPPDRDSREAALA